MIRGEHGTSCALGVEVSTQSVTVIVVSSSEVHPTPIAHATVNFDSSLPRYGTVHGAHINDPSSAVGDQGGRCATAPIEMWLEGITLALSNLRRVVESKGLHLTIESVSFAAQQHAAVLIRDTSAFAVACNALGTTAAITRSLVLPDARLWLDTTTKWDRIGILARLAESRDVACIIEEADRVMNDISGSNAELRYTAAQLCGIVRREGWEAWARVSKIHLLSSFLTAVFVGDANVAPVDSGDAAGMNLMDLRTNMWSSELCAATNLPNLMAKLPHIVSKPTVVSRSLSTWARICLGPLASSSCAVVAGTGDNMASLVGSFTSHPGTMSVSFGTSDVAVYVPSTSHLDDSISSSVTEGSDIWLPACVAPSRLRTPFGDLMVMACLTATGGAIAREAARNGVADDWDKADARVLDALTTTDPTQLYECVSVEVFKILDSLRQGLPFTLNWAIVDNDDTTRIARYLAVPFVQITALRHSLRHLTSPLQLLLTGGGSRNPILRALAQCIFSVPYVYRVSFNVPSTAAYGAALIALAGTGRGPVAVDFSAAHRAGYVQCDGVDYPRLIDTITSLVKFLESAFLAKSKEG